MGGIHLLGEKQVERLLARWRTDPAAAVGKYCDGGGLYLRLERDSATWTFRYRNAERQERAMSLGPTHTLTLDEARERARQCRIKLLDGVDPLGARNRESTTFAKFFGLYWNGDGSSPGVKETIGVAKTRRIWETTMGYAMPVIGDLPLDKIQTPHIAKILAPLSHEVAYKLRSRIERVLDDATAKGHRTGDNPARKALLQTILVPKAKVAVAKERHHGALEYADLPTFMVKLRATGATPKARLTALALEWLILTACRRGDILGQVGGPDEAPPLMWHHVHEHYAIWATPTTKNGLQHLVPLCARGLAIVGEVRALGYGTAPDDLVFPIGSNALYLLTKQLGATLTAHGFRGTFKTWAEQETGTKTSVIEAVLAHGVTGDKVEMAYMRGDFFVARKALLEHWADYIDGTVAAQNVIQLHKRIA